MNQNDITIRKLARDLAASKVKITKKAARESVRRTRFEKDAGNSEGRAAAVADYAVEFRAVQVARAAARSPTPVESRRDVLYRIKRERFLSCVQRAGFQRTANGEHADYVTFVASPNEVHAVSWSGPSGLRATDKRIDTEHRYFVPSDWWTSIHGKGLSWIDGRLTLYASSEENFAGVSVREAVWVTQGISCSLAVHRGFVARNGEHVRYADTKAAAANFVAGHRRMG